MVMGRERGCNHDTGQAMGLVIVSVTLIMGMSFGLARIAVGVAQQSSAQNAADAAALAGAVGGVPEAKRVAERNGGHLVAFERLDTGGADTVIVTVECGGQSATARASDAP